MTSFSRPSPIIFSIRIPRVTNASTAFTYNYYVSDEGTNEASGVPEYYRLYDPDKISTENSSFTIKVPRFVTVSWTPPPLSVSFFSTPFDETKTIKNNLEKVVSEDNFVNSPYFSYSFSGVDDIQNSYQNINNGGTLDLGLSQAASIDSYVSSLLKDYSATLDSTSVNNTKEQIASAVESIEKIADNPFDSLGISFYNKNGNRITNTSGFDSLIEDSEFLHSQINVLVANDVFLSSSLSSEAIKKLNTFYQDSLKRSLTNLNEATVKPVDIGPIKPGIAATSTEKNIIGYVIEKYEFTESGFKKDKVFTIDNPRINKIVDVTVKYGTKYFYMIRTVASISTPAFDNENQEIRNITYYVSSKPTITTVVCEEYVPPPPPVDINFVWDYTSNKLNVVWGIPVNPQRDIKQFQVLRRKSIYEPFELINQKSFDFSTKKYLSNEKIDGNKKDMNAEESSFVEFLDFPVFSHIDEDFSVDVELLSSSKYIYALASIDAHGLISNYSAQFEVYFDFFKNKIIKKMISSAGAPRPYPNLNIRNDLFKDAIRTKGFSQGKMKIYFMPEYFRLYYSNGLIQQMIGTKQ